MLKEPAYTGYITHDSIDTLQYIYCQQTFVFFPNLKAKGGQIGEGNTWRIDPFVGG